MQSHTSTKPVNTHTIPLMLKGSIIVSEIFVFTRAIEDVIDLLLIRSRSESELATLMTQVDKLRALDR